MAGQKHLKTELQKDATLKVKAYHTVSSNNATPKK